MDERLFQSVESYIENHTALTGPDAREAIRAIYQGEAVTLPEATTPEGAAIRETLNTALSHSSTPAPASPAAHVPASMDAAARRIVLRAAAGPRLVAFADALAATTMSDADALRAIEVAKADLPPERPPVPPIEERASGLPEFGSTFIDASPSASERAKAGWTKALEKARG